MRTPVISQAAKNATVIDSEETHGPAYQNGNSSAEQLLQRAASNGHNQKRNEAKHFTYIFTKIQSDTTTKSKALHTTKRREEIQLQQIRERQVQQDTTQYKKAVRERHNTTKIDSTWHKQTQPSKTRHTTEHRDSKHNTSHKCITRRGKLELPTR